MNKLILLFILSLSTTVTFSEEKILKADFRHRPPEMIVNGEDKSGPLKDIIEEAVAKIGYQLKWRKTPFSRSFVGLKNGQVDIVPRTIRNKERAAFINYLGPIGYQQKNIEFLVRKGQEGLLQNYEDLYSVRVGLKRDTAYFDKFNHDKKINRKISFDDKNMANMFKIERFDTMIILDKTSIEKALAEIGFIDYSYANYKYVQKIGIYYGFSKKSSHAHVYPKLNEVLLEMAKSGRVAEIYKQHKIAALIH